MSLHGIQNLCLHIIHKNYLCLHVTHRKRAVVYMISRPIFWNLYIINQDYLFGLSGLEGEFLGLGLWNLAKELRYLLLKRQNDKKTGRVLGKSENPFFSKRVSVYDWPLDVDKRAIVFKESALTISCLQCAPSLIVYTAAKKSTRDHVYDCVKVLA